MTVRIPLLPLAFPLLPLVVLTAAPAAAQENEDTDTQTISWNVLDNTSIEVADPVLDFGSVLPGSSQNQGTEMSVQTTHDNVLVTVEVNLVPLDGSTLTLTGQVPSGPSLGPLVLDNAMPQTFLDESGTGGISLSGISLTYTLDVDETPTTGTQTVNVVFTATASAAP